MVFQHLHSHLPSILDYPRMKIHTPRFQKVMDAGVQKNWFFAPFFFHLKTNRRIQKFEHLEYSSVLKLTKFNISSDLHFSHSVRTVYTMTVIVGHQVPIAKANKVISFLSHFVTWPNPSHTTLRRYERFWGIENFFVFGYVVPGKLRHRCMLKLTQVTGLLFAL